MLYLGFFQGVYVKLQSIRVQLIRVKTTVYACHLQRDINANVQFIIQDLFVKYLSILVIILHAVMVEHVDCRETLLYSYVTVHPVCGYVLFYRTCRNLLATVFFLH